MKSKIVKYISNSDVIALVVLIVFVVSFMVDVAGKSFAARLLPQSLGTLLLILLAMQSFRNFKEIKKRETLQDDFNEGIEKVFSSPKLKTITELYVLPIFVGIMFLYYMAIYAFGYLYATFFFLIVTMWLLGLKNKMLIVVISAVSVAMIHIIFVMGFNFFMPRGNWL